jgi:putative ABC transport system permease protein
MNFIALKMLTGDGAKYFGLVFAIAFCTFLLENQTSIFAGILKRTGDQFQWDCIRYYLKNTGIPVNFGITIAIALIVGTVVAGQTFYLFTVENLKQFGTLKAIGVTNCRLTGMVLLQALTVGLIGFGLGTGMAAEFFDFFGHHNLATRGIILMWQSVALTAGCIFLVVIIASLLSIRRVVVLEPAAVFRG